MPAEQELVTIQVRVPKHAADAVRAILEGMCIPPGSSESVFVAAFVHVEKGLGGPMTTVAPCGGGSEGEMTARQVFDCVIGCAMISASAWHAARGIAAKLERGTPGVGASLMGLFDDSLRDGKAMVPFSGNDMTEVISNAPAGFVRRYLGDGGQNGGSNASGD